MRSVQIALPAAVLLVAGVLMLGLGCSHDSGLDPATGDFAIDTYSMKVEPNPEPGLGDPTFVDTFDKHVNVGGWSFFGNPDNPYEKIEMQGGNPGAYLHEVGLDTYAPQLRTPIGYPSIFTGNYREKGVSRVGVDIAIFGAGNSGGRPLSLLLRNENGTPYDYSDDIQVFWTGTKLIPQPNGAFKEFSIDIPSQSTALPKGWKVMYGYSTGDDDADWNTVMQDVSQITFFFGDPEMFFMFQIWEIGVDNPRIWLDE